MKKYWNVISIVVCLLLLGAAVLMRVCPRKPSPEDLGRIYCLYADSKHIDASLIKGYRINDTLKMDVVILEGIDTTGWAQLKKEFDIKTHKELECPEGYTYEDWIALDTLPGCSFFLINRNDTTFNHPPKRPSNDELQVFWQHGTNRIFIFDTKTRNEQSAVSYKTFYEVFKDCPKDEEEKDGEQTTSNQKQVI